MIKCDHCRKPIANLPHTCRYCGETHCPNHLLPENHDCHGVKNRESWERVFKGDKKPKKQGFKKRKGKEKKYYSSSPGFVSKNVKTRSKASDEIINSSSSGKQEKNKEKEFKAVRVVNSKNMARKKSGKKVTKEDFSEKGLDFIRWGFVCIVSIFISYFIIGKLNITNNLLIILTVAVIISVIIELVKSHNHNYRFRKEWFFFYFLVYSNIVWIANELLFEGMILNQVILSSVSIGLITSLIIVAINEIKPKYSSLPWAYLVLIVILVIGNLGSLGFLTSLGSIDEKPPVDNSGLSEERQPCPTTLYGSEVPLILTKTKLSSVPGMQTMAKSMVNLVVWEVENELGTCYLGKYKGQHPNWIYCDDLIVSRFETDDSGVINYRWYTAASSIWKPVEGSADSYIFDKFVCEGGQKVELEKGVTNYYVYDSRSGSQIRIAY